MNIPRRLVAISALSLALLSGARAEDPAPATPAADTPAPAASAPDPRTMTDREILNKTPVLTAEELQKVLFSPSWSYVTGDGLNFNFELQNPFRDKDLLGLVINVSFKDPVTNKPVTYDAIIRVTCGPLGSESGRCRLYRQPYDEKDERVVTLKEVHYRPAQ